MQLQRFCNKPLSKITQADLREYWLTCKKDYGWSPATLRISYTYPDDLPKVECRDVTPITCGRHGDWGRALFLSASRRVCGMTLREIGAVAGGLNEAAAGIAIRRFNRKVSQDKFLQKRQNDLFEMLDVRIWPRFHFHGKILAPIWFKPWTFECEKPVETFFDSRGCGAGSRAGVDSAG